MLFDSFSFSERFIKLSNNSIPAEIASDNPKLIAVCNATTANFVAIIPAFVANNLASNPANFTPSIFVLWPNVENIALANLVSLICFSVANALASNFTFNVSINPLNLPIGVNIDVKLVIVVLKFLLSNNKAVTVPVIATGINPNLSVKPVSASIIVIPISAKDLIASELTNVV